MSLSAVLVLALGAFDLRMVPLPEPGAVSFVVPWEEGAPALCIQDTAELRLFVPRRIEPERARLMPGCTAYDIARGPGDLPELLMLTTEGLYAAPLEGPAREPVRLFAAQHVLGASGAAAPRVIAVSHGSRTAYAIPAADGIELRSRDGELVVRYPYGDGRVSAFGEQFTAWTVAPHVTAPTGGLEFQVTRLRAYEAVLPPHLAREEPEATAFRRVSPTQFAEAAQRRFVHWPWFPLRTAGQPNDRVLFAPAPPALRDTVVRIQRDTGAGAAERTVSPERRYTGLPAAPPDALPDFNGDGNVDLLLWSARAPATSVDALARALVRRSYPLRVAAHLYDPETGRYEAVPSGIMNTRAPVAWFLLLEGGTPLRHTLLDDLNGDGLTDCAWSTEAREFEFRFSRDGAFPQKPDAAPSFPGPVHGIAHVFPAWRGGPKHVVLRGTNVLYWLAPAIDAD
jgi:hypothetical protein